MQLEDHSKETKAKISGIHLPWMCRISIVTDTARGLAYLHTADKVPLVHRDVKRWAFIRVEMLRDGHLLEWLNYNIAFSYCSANVLLDLAFRAKVGDFGLARALQEHGSSSTSRIIGTSGYIPPEYYQGKITTKMDTFSFGVVGDLCLCSSYNEIVLNIGLSPKLPFGFSVV